MRLPNDLMYGFIALRGIFDSIEQIGLPYLPPILEELQESD